MEILKIIADDFYFLFIWLNLLFIVGPSDIKKILKYLIVKGLPFLCKQLLVFGIINKVILPLKRLRITHKIKEIYPALFTVVG